MGGGVGGMVYSIQRTEDPQLPTPNRQLQTIICSHANHRGDIIARSDEDGSLTSFALYEAYGTRPYEWGDDPDRQKANTKEEEKDLGLVDDGLRYRDLETGTYLTRDPIGYDDGPNIYCYVHCNPIMSFDAFGLYDEDEAYEAAQDYFKNEYDGDIEKFEDWYNQDKWYDQLADQGITVYDSSFTLVLHQANEKAGMELLSSGSAAGQRELNQLILYARGGNGEPVRPYHYTDGNNVPEVSGWFVPVVGDVETLMSDASWGWKVAALGSIALDCTGVGLIPGTSTGTLRAGKKLVTEGSYLVYKGVDNAGVVRYAGITKRELGTRVAEHIASGGGKEALTYMVVEGAEGLSRQGARVWEQTLINQFGLGKNGGQLLNKINSISPKYWSGLGITP